MGDPRAGIAGGLLALEGVIAALAVSFHYVMTAEYGDVTASALEGASFPWVGGPALVLVGAAALATAVVSSRMWMRVVAVLIPAAMVGSVLLVTPVALRHKLEDQYDAVPQCVFDDGATLGLGVRAELQSQQAFDSIDHVGHFSEGGGSGVGGCDRPFVLTEDIDVLRHYRSALPAAGWRVVEDDAARLRAERDGMAFEVVTCERVRGGVVWAGRVGEEERGARCDQQ